MLMFGFEPMTLLVGVTLVYLTGLIWIQQSLCDELSGASVANNWTCTCSSSNQRNQIYALKYNCSASCDCNPVGGSNGDRWTCSCAGDGFPKTTVDNHNNTCFTACNCTAGSLPERQESGKHISSRVVVVVLSLCIILTTLAFLASAICYFYQKEKFSVRPPLFSPDTDLSCNSATNLLSLRSSVSETKVNISFPITPIIGCFGKDYFLLRNKTGIVHGTIMQFLYCELEAATDKFSNANLIGFGGSSYVYRGVLKGGRTVAVKRLIFQEGPNSDSVFSTEVELLSRLHHCHVVPLLGYCSEFRGKQPERLLVFEYMPNGTLRDCLDGNSGENLTWETRIKIAIGAARGLEYLHEAAAPKILHRDIKSTNILLDEHWRARITDLGMAKRLRADGVASSSNSPARMQGTFGYFAPEYAMVGKASLMSDVFSFGVVLLELITGRHPIHRSTSKGEESLVLWATSRLQDNKRVIAELPDPRLKGNYREEELLVMAYLAKECLLLDPDARPTMTEVVQILSTISPNKSRRNVPINLFQRSASYSMKVEEHIDRLHSRSSLPPGMENTMPIRSHSKEMGTLSPEFIERLILLTSNARSLRATDEEAVDLTEPRFESFHLPTAKSP